MLTSFFDQGMHRLNDIVRPGMLCAFDFDGTLAPIVTQPDKASLPAPVLRRLTILSEYAPIAIITGRSIADICTRLSFVPDYVIGNHGIEGLPGETIDAEHYKALCNEWEARLNLALQAHPSIDPGIWIENKTYSLSIHYRLATNRTLAEKHLLALFARVTPEADIGTGKCVFNLLPPGAPNKGIALQRLCESCQAPTAIYVGDDITDEDVFNMHRKDWLSLRIERSDDTAAEFYLNHRLDIVRLLDELIARLAAMPKWKNVTSAMSG